MSASNGTPVTANQIADLREQTGAGIMECKRALQESQGDMAKAKIWLRERGVALAAKKEGREATKGLVGSYIHAGGSMGVLVELSCETDFVARTDDFQNLMKELCFQVAAMSPLWVSRDQVPADKMEAKLREFEQEAVKANKPAEIAAKIAQGKLEDFLSKFCLDEQIYVKDESHKIKVKDLITEAVAKLGERIIVRRFARFQVGGE